MKRILITITILLLINGLFASANKSNKNGIKKYDEENFEGALIDFRDAQLDDPKSPVIGHNIGSALYQQKRFDKAAEELNKTLTAAEDDSTLLSQLYYNLGNSWFRQDSLLQSIEYYKKALQYRPEDEDAKYNLELARALLKDNSEQQQQDQNQQQNQEQQQQQQQQQNQDQDQDQQDQQDQQQEQEQDKEQQDQENQDQNQDEKDQEQEEQQQNQPKPKENPEELTEEEAKQLLKNLQDQEEDLQKERMKAKVGGGRAGKQW